MDENKGVNAATESKEEEKDYSGDPFFASLVTAVRGVDQYGSWEKFTDVQLLKMKYIKSKEDLKKIPRGGDMDPRVPINIRLMLQGVALEFEKRTGEFATVVLDMSHEAFGRGLVLAGGVVAVEQFYREAQRFSYTSMEKLLEEGNKMVEKGVKNFQNFQPCMQK